MRYHVIEHTDRAGRRYYYTWSEEQLRENPGRGTQPGRESQTAGIFDTEEAALEAQRNWSRDAGT